MIYVDFCANAFGKAKDYHQCLTGRCESKCSSCDCSNLSKESSNLEIDKANRKDMGQMLWQSKLQSVNTFANTGANGKY